MGFVVEKFPFRSIIVFNWTVLIISHGKGFRAGAKKEIFGAVQPNPDCAGPDDFSDAARLGSTDF